MLVLKHIDGSLGDGDPAGAVNRGTGLNQEDKTRPTMHPTWRYTNNDAQVYSRHRTVRWGRLDGLATRHIQASRS